MGKLRLMVAATLIAGLTVAGVGGPAGASHRSLVRVSVDAGGAAGNDFSGYPAISDDGAAVAFQSTATNLVSGDTNATQDVFVWDAAANAVSRASVTTTGLQADGPSGRSSISADGRFVAFQSTATNLAVGDTNGSGSDVFLRDTAAGTTVLVSLPTGTTTSGSSFSPAISADGRFVAFWSYSRLTPQDANPGADVYLRDLQTNTTELVSIPAVGGAADADSYKPSISADGRYVAFVSDATNLVSGDANAASDVFVRDRTAGTTIRASVGTGAVEGDADADGASISADGGKVAFFSNATNLVPADTNATPDVFVRDLTAGTTTLVSAPAAGGIGNASSFSPTISDDGTMVAFASTATNLVAADANGRDDVFARHLPSGALGRISEVPDGDAGNDHSRDPAVSSNGDFIAFASLAKNLVSGGSPAVNDVFRARLAAPPAPTVSSPAPGTIVTSPSVTFTGTTEPRLDVRLSEGAGVLATARADAAGAWSATVTLTGDGAHDVDAQAVDLGRAGPAARHTVVLDTIDPEAPTNVVVTPSLIGGADVAQVHVTGNGEPGATALIDVSSSGGGPAVSATPPISSGAFDAQVNVGALADGTLTATVRVRDAANRVGPEAQATATKDTVSTTPSVTAPASGQTTGRRPQVSGTAEPGATVTVLFDGTDAGTTVADGAGAWTLTPSQSLADGSHDVSARAVDVAGNTSVPSTAVGFVVDAVNPNATVAVVDGDGYVNAAEAQSPLPIDWTMTEAGPAVTVSAHAPSAPPPAGCTSTATAARPPTAGQVTLSMACLQALPEGQILVELSGTDAYGNAAQASDTSILDLHVPAPPDIDHPTQGVTIVSTSVTVDGTAESRARVRLFDAGLQIASVDADDAGAWSVIVTLAPGAHALTATVTDAADNVSGPSAVRTIAVDTAGVPTVAFDDGPDHRIRQADSHTVTLSGSRPAGSALDIVVTDQAEATPDARATLAAGAASWSVTVNLSSLALGRLTASVVATDPQGRLSGPGTASTRKVPNDPTAPVPPRVEIRDRDGLTAPKTTDVTQVAVDVVHLGPSASASMTLTVTDGTRTATFDLDGDPAADGVQRVPVDTPTRALVDLSSFADGAVTMTATVTSATPNLTGQDATTLDQHAPRSTWSSSSPTLCVVIPILAQTNCGIGGETTDTASAVQFVYVVGASDRGGTFGQTARLAARGAFSTGWTITNDQVATLSPGTWTFHARAVDAADNQETEASNTFTLMVL